MTSEAELKTILARLRERDRQVLTFAAILAAESGLGESVVVVGGSALEIYTKGGYASGDIDLVGDSKQLQRTLLGWGFRREARYWVHDELRIFVDIPGSYYNGEFYRTRLLTTAYGPVRLAEPEYLLVRRLAAAKYWKDSKALDEATLLAAELEAEIDWAYTETFAQREQVDDLLPELRRRLDALRRSTSGRRARRARKGNRQA